MFLVANAIKLLHVITSAAAKQVLLVQDNISAYEISIFRSVYNLATSSVYLALSDAKLVDGLHESKRLNLLVRSAAGTLSKITGVFAVMYMPLTDSFVL